MLQDAWLLPLLQPVVHRKTVKQVRNVHPLRPTRLKVRHPKQTRQTLLHLRLERKAYKLSPHPEREPLHVWEPFLKLYHLVQKVWTKVKPCKPASLKHQTPLLAWA